MKFVLGSLLLKSLSCVKVSEDIMYVLQVVFLMCCRLTGSIFAVLHFVAV